MADYRQSSFEGVIIRVEDHVCIPDDPANADRIEYERWLAEGGELDPYVGPTLAMPVRAQPRR